MPTPERTTAFWGILIAYAVFNLVSTWVVFVLALFVSYPGGGDEDKAARVVAHLEKMFLSWDGVCVFAVYSPFSVALHILFWHGLIRNSPEHSRFKFWHGAYAVAVHVALFVGGHVLALPFVLK